MRILMATQNYHANVNGAAIFTVRLAEGLVARGHQVMVLVPSERRRPYRVSRNGVALQGVGALPLAADVFVTLRPGRAVERAFDDFDPEVVHIQDHYPLSRSVLRAARARHLPVVATNNFLPENIITQVPPFRLMPHAIARVLWQLDLAVLNRADVVTTPTETGAGILRGQGLRRPVEVISSGVDVRRFAPPTDAGRDELCARYGFTPGQTHFLYVGRMQGDKNLDVLLDAMQRLPVAAGAQLMLAGKGNLLAGLRRRAAQLGVDGRVVFAGYVPSADLPGLLAAADVFAMPSMVELQSIATLEAMAAGRPVLAANARALPELVADGVNGYLFAPREAADAARRMLDLMASPERRAAMGAASRAIALRHDERQTQERYAQVYAAVALLASGEQSESSH
jgi:1,2-diacylglycerol 3-alpha-glucosyltransferase